jgi:phytoene/squalene synthetase
MAVAVHADPDSRAAFAAARDSVRRADGVVGEAYRAAFFLPRAKRDAIYAATAFVGLIRQAVPADAGESGGGGGGGGGCCGGSDGVTAVVKSRIDSLYAGSIELPRPEFRDASQWTYLAMADVVKRFEIPRAYLHDLVDGLVAVRGVRRYATWNALERHCDLVGGSIAKVAACVLGMTHSDGPAFAAKIGIATRLVGILRTFGPDIEQDRIYLPLEDFVHCRCSERDLKAGEAMKAARLIRFEVERARDFLRQGSEGLCWLAGDGSRMAAAMFVATQGEHLDAIERAGFHPTASNSARRSPARRLRQLSTAWRLARRTPDEPLPRVG